MAAKTNNPETEREMIITRVFDAPRQRVFDAWTQPEIMKRWWGPRGYSLSACTIDLRPGGAVHFAMRSPDGLDTWCKGVYRDIVEPERIVFNDFFSDEQGNVVAPTHYGLIPEWPMETLVTVTFDDEQGKTRLTLRPGVSESLGKRQMADLGWGQSLDRLAEYLEQS